MNSWNAGYVTDVEYIHGVYRELTPAILHFTALAAGIRAPNPNDALTYCELGCGQGDSVNLLAAANPHIEFFATDFNPSHIAGAKALAAAAATPNAHFFDKSFQEFAALPTLPEFDIIALHGIYSWISAEDRRTIVDFIRSRLKVGGLVYVSYNALPGWGAISPLRRLIADHADTISGPAPLRLQQSLAFVQRLIDVAPAFFRQNPLATDRFEKVKAASQIYAAHEYLNRESTPFYHADVAAQLGEAKLTYVGSAALKHAIDVAGLTPEQHAFLKSIPTPAQRETILDFLFNRQFRSDLYVKGPVSLGAIEMRDQWSRTRFALSADRDTVPLKVTGVLGESTLLEEVYSPVLDGLASGPRTTEDLMGLPAVASLGLSKVTGALTVLVGAGYVQPCLASAGDNGRSARTRSFNTTVMDRARSDDQLLFLASPVTGGRILADRVSLLLLLALQNGEKDPPQFAWAQLDAGGQKLMRENKLLETPEENLAEMRSVFARFTATGLPMLRSIGIARPMQTAKSASGTSRDLHQMRRR